MRSVLVRTWFGLCRHVLPKSCQTFLPCFNVVLLDKYTPFFQYFTFIYTLSHLCPIIAVLVSFCSTLNIIFLFFGCASWEQIYISQGKTHALFAAAFATANAVTFLREFCIARPRERALSLLRANVVSSRTCDFAKSVFLDHLWFVLNLLRFKAFFQSWILVQCLKIAFSSHCLCLFPRVRVVSVFVSIARDPYHLG